MSIYNKSPLPSTSKIDRGYSSGADNGLDTLRSQNVKKFQKDTYAGLTEHLAVVLRVESNPEQGLLRGGENNNRHSLFSAGGSKQTHVVRARIISSNVHEYIPKPINAQDNQLIDIYPAFEMSPDMAKTAPPVNSLIRVQFYDREISSKRNLNGQILSIETSKAGSSYSKNLAWSQAPTPAMAGTGGGSAPTIPPAALKKISTGTGAGVVSTAGKGATKVETIAPRWPLEFNPATKRGQGGGHNGIDAITGGKNGIKVLATMDGEVRKVYFSTPNAKGRSGGCTVVIDHPKAVNPEDNIQGVSSWYMHLSKRLTPLTAGTQVKRGQVIGLSGGGTYDDMIAHQSDPPPAPKANGALPSKAQVLKYTGGSTGPHLHFEIRNKQDDNIDVLKFLQGPIEQKA
jgi:murein DD-endopeptidase MepM/ murein hydrolase activator NlpD